MKSLKSIAFITSNVNKVREAAVILDMPIKQVVFDVPEIQSLDPHELIAAKLHAALHQHEPPLLVEDTSFVCEAMGRLPGPFIKYFEQELGNSGLYELLKNQANLRAHAVVTLGFAPNRDETEFFEGKVSGTLVAPRGHEGWGFDFIFQPDGHSQTYAEMGMAKKSSLSHRFLAFSELKKFLEARR